jgi:hypothetical protein
MRCDYTRIRDCQLEHLINTSKFPEVEMRAAHSTERGERDVCGEVSKKEKRRNARARARAPVRMHSSPGTAGN